MPIFHIIWTAALLVIFVSIIVWAWSSKRQSDFRQASQLPLEDDSSPRTNKHSGEHHG